MSKGLASFITGMGNGYLDAQQRTRDQARQDKQDAWQTAEQDRKKLDWDRQDKLNQGLADAIKPATMSKERIHVVAPDEMGPSSAQYRVKGQGLDQAFNDETQAQKSLADYSSPDAVVERQAGVYTQNLMPEKAMALKADRKKGALADFEYTQAVQTHANNQANIAIQNEIDANRGDTFKTMAGILTKTNIGGLEGTKVEARPSADGKRMQMVSISPDGVEKVFRDYPNDTSGHVAAHQDMMKADPVKKIQWAHERSREEKKDAVTLLEFERKVAADAEDNRHKKVLERNSTITAEAARTRAQNSGGGRGGSGGVAKPLPVAALRMQGEAVDAIGTAAGIRGQIATIQQQITDGKLDFGPMSNRLNELTNAFGISGEESKNFASFKATLEKMRNDSLRLNAGVQTDGDSQRAWNELVANISDKGVVEQRLSEIAKLNERAEELQKLRVDQIRGNYNAPPMDFENIATPPKTEPATVKSRAEWDKLPPGAVFIGPDGKKRTKP